MITLHDTVAGVRLVHNLSAGEVGYFGVAINAGSRDENHAQEGLAHFVEHTIFKGTGRRKSWHIINCMESVGGELNAYTTKEETMIYTVFPRGNASRAIDLIADLVNNSVFPTSELEKEREVVAEEIDSYLDTPSENVFDEFENRLFKGSSLGHNILGTPESISRFGTTDCIEWIYPNYVAERMVIFYSGPEKSSIIKKMVDKHFNASTVRHGEMPTREIPVEVTPFNASIECDNHQAHTIIGARIPGIYSELRRPLSLLSNIIGGPGMNSLLNIELRERRGLVYSVDSSISAFTDSGAIEIYFGCNPSDNDRCIDHVRRVLGNISEHGLTDRKLAAAKKQYIGQLIVGTENREQMALGIARTTLLELEVKTLDEIINEVEKISQDDMGMVYPLLSPDRMSILSLV